MFRCGAARFAANSLPRPHSLPLRTISKQSIRRTPPLSHGPQFAVKSGRPLGLAPYKSASLAVVRFATTLADDQDVKHEHDMAQKRLKPHPERVSSESSMPQTVTPEPEEDWGGGIKSEWKVVKETFSLAEVPKDALYLGLAGVLPYLATSLSTVYLAYDLNHAKVHGFGVFLDADAAAFGLQLVQPIQIGYGAVIISFLGAIHWGFEWAGLRGHYPWDRYKVGVIAPAIAWPTLLLPVEEALIAQFLGFVYLYFNDANMTTRGIAPPWYGIYRFVLTFIVGSSIVLTLVGRGQVAEYLSHPERPTDVVSQYADRRAELIAQEEREKAERRAAQAEAGDEDEDEDDEEAASEDEGDDEE